jgi:mRNA interferase HicA
MRADQIKMQHFCCFFLLQHLCCLHERTGTEEDAQKAGCEFEAHRGGSGHITVTLNGKKTQLPMHGAAKELGTGLVDKILKDLGLK